MRVILLLISLLATSCSINKMAMNSVSDALTGSGSADVFTGDSDPELVGDALPFAIKMYESLLSSNPKHDGLILATGSLFVMYANAFVQGPAEMLPSAQYEARENGKHRAKKLYLRGMTILYGGLNKKYPGFTEASGQGKLDALLGKMKKADVPLLYWTVAGALAAYSQMDPTGEEGIAFGSKLPELRGMMQRAYELDPDFNNGALDEFYVLFYASLPEIKKGDKNRAEDHFKKAVEKTKGLSASPYVSYVQAVLMPPRANESEENMRLRHDAFTRHLETALAIDVDSDPSNRLVNILAQRKAQYLLDNQYYYFPELDPGDED